MNYKDLFINETKTIDKALQQLEETAMGILYVVDGQDQLIAALTDGDIRRQLLNKPNLDAKIKDAANYNPKYLFVEEQHLAKQKMAELHVMSIPIVNHKMVIKKIFFFNREQLGEKKNLKLPVVMMAGGKGTRLYPYTKILPKPLIPVGDLPISELIMNRFESYGCNDFYLIVNHKKELIKTYFCEAKGKRNITFYDENQPLGTGGGLSLIKEQIKETFFLTNCDVIINCDYSDIYKYHLEAGNVITMVSALKNFQVPYGVLHTDDTGILESMEEKPKLSYFINTGMYIINPKAIDLIPNDTVFHMTHLVEKVMAQGGKVGTYPVSEDSFLDMGELSEMKRMKEKLGLVTNNG